MNSNFKREEEKKEKIAKNKSCHLSTTLKEMIFTKYHSYCCSTKPNPRGPTSYNKGGPNASTFPIIQTNHSLS